MTHRPYLSGCSISVPVGMRLLVVSDPHEGASALLRVLAGLSRPSRGRVELAGLADDWARRVTYLGPDPGLHAWMTPREVLDLAAGLLGLGDDEAARRVQQALAWVHVRPEEAGRPISRSGPPVIQRVGLASALMGDPEVLLFDEPIRALDEMERARLLTDLGRRRTVLLASRYPASDAAFASHVALIRDGRVVMLASIKELEAEGFPVSMGGIAALAERRGPAPRAGPPAAAP